MQEERKQSRSRSRVFDDIPEEAHQRAIDRLNELRNKHPYVADWDLLLLALATELSTKSRPDSDKH